MELAARIGTMADSPNVDYEQGFFSRSTMAKKTIAHMKSRLNVVQGHSLRLTGTGLTATDSIQSHCYDADMVYATYFTMYDRTITVGNYVFIYFNFTLNDDWTTDFCVFDSTDNRYIIKNGMIVDDSANGGGV